MVGVRTFVDEGLGHSSYLVDLGDGTAAIVDPPRFPSPHLSAAAASGHGAALDDRHPLPRRLRDRQPGAGRRRRRHVHRPGRIQARDAASRRARRGADRRSPQA